MTNAELAILSLVAEQPRHGYEIEQVIEARGMREWTEVGFSSIYYVLKKLEKAGLIESAVAPAKRGLGKKVYSITAAGREALQAATRSALAESGPCYPAFLLGLANQPALPPDEVLAALRVYAEALRARDEQMQARQAAQQPLPAHVNALFDYSRVLTEAEYHWVQDYIKQLEQAIKESKK